MSKFSCNFLDHPTDDHPVPERYRDYFSSYDQQRWVTGSKGGSFVYFDDENNKWSLTISNHPKYGISILYNVKIKTDIRREEWVSQGDKDKLGDFEDIGDGIILPIGSFLAPAEAWLAVEDFITDPTIKSERITWVDSRKLSWPTF